jgi:SAM-dependent methyltransferase
VTVAALPGVTLACPRCHTPLARDGEGYQCPRGDGRYPVVAGVPDCRILPDPWISIPDDRAKARRVETLTADADFPAAVRTYWSITPETPDDRKEHFIRAVLDGERLAAEWLEGVAGSARAGDRWLDLGCGTGNLIAAAEPRGIEVVGLDIALRWLVVARRRPGLASGLRLVCGDAGHLPFEDGTFAAVTALGVLEHCDDLDGALREVRRVLQPGGRLLVRTVNRFSLLPEPHVGLWGVGYLPRRWADGYVRWRTGLRYLHHYPRSGGALARGLRRAGLHPVRLSAARTLAPDRERLGHLGRRVIPAYERARTLPGLRRAVSLVAPLLELEAVRS